MKNILLKVFYISLKTWALRFLKLWRKTKMKRKAWRRMDKVQPMAIQNHLQIRGLKIQKRIRVKKIMRVTNTMERRERGTEVGAIGGSMDHLLSNFTSETCHIKPRNHHSSNILPNVMGEKTSWSVIFRQRGKQGNPAALVL